jgi:hypothetical protein
MADRPAEPTARTYKQQKGPSLSSEDWRPGRGEVLRPKGQPRTTAAPHNSFDDAGGKTAEGRAVRTSATVAAVAGVREDARGKRRMRGRKEEKESGTARCITATEMAAVGGRGDGRGRRRLKRRKEEKETAVVAAAGRGTVATAPSGGTEATETAVVAAEGGGAAATAPSRGTMTTVRGTVEPAAWGAHEASSRPLPPEDLGGPTHEASSRPLPPGDLGGHGTTTRERAGTSGEESGTTKAKPTGKGTRTTF